MRRRYHKQARTLSVRANDGSSGRETTDQGNYFRCWNCGFICDIRRDLLSKDGRRGTVLTEGTATSHGDTTLYHGVEEAHYLTTGAGEDSVLSSEASNVPIARSITVGGTGCPLCHTTAWKKL